MISWSLAQRCTEAGEETHQAPQEPQTLDGRVEISRGRDEEVQVRSRLQAGGTGAGHTGVTAPGKTSPAEKKVLNLRRGKFFLFTLDRSHPLRYFISQKGMIKFIIHGAVCCSAFHFLQLIREDLRASTGGGGERSEWWRGGGEEGRGGATGEEEQEEAQMSSLENYVELLYEGKDKVRFLAFP